MVCDVGDSLFPEGILATTDATLHAVLPCEGLEDLGRIYGARVVVHHSAASAWQAATECRFAVLDVGRRLSQHLDALARLGAEEGAPRVVLQGIADIRAGFDAAVKPLLDEQGWAVVELPGFEPARLALPPGQWDDDFDLEPFLDRLRKLRASGSSITGADAAAIEDLQERLATAQVELGEAQARREHAVRAAEGMQDVIAALRTFNDEARAEAADLRQLVTLAEQRSALAAQDTVRLTNRVAALEHVHLAVHQDLGRLRRSQAWRLGHWLTKAGRVMTFRKPGRTDGFEKALERLDGISRRSSESH